MTHNNRQKLTKLPISHPQLELQLNIQLQLGDPLSAQLFDQLGNQQHQHLLD